MYYFFFVLLAAVCAGFQYKTWRGSTLNTSAVFKSFQITYLSVYLVMTCADWLQGPFVYALYESYGYSMNDIGVLFIVGFGSSMIFGTFVGSLGDKYGRKFACIAFGIIYSLSCLTKLVNNFWVLLLGRLLGGIATSLLYSSFESWMVHEHNEYRYGDDWLAQTFSYATFGNGLVSILAGLLASFVADNWGYVAPFMASLVFLVIGTIVVSLRWKENYGNSDSDIQDTFKKAFRAMITDKKILLVGAIQSLFEGSMYTFVFMWTPALQQAHGEGDLPYGMIFASYMVAIMVGSAIFSVSLEKFGLEETVKYNLIAASASLGISAVVQNEVILFIAFIIFEVSCGVYFPSQGTLRGKYIPGDYRSAIMNYFRIPLNLIVVLVLLKAGDISLTTVFTLCTIFLVVAVFAQVYLMKIIYSGRKSVPIEDNELVEDEKTSDIPV